MSEIKMEKEEDESNAVVAYLVDERTWRDA